ncbi:MAG TPA: PAS domain-containing sensor histidine kinase [Ohtaekwangia sp.]
MEPTPGSVNYLQDDKFLNALAEAYRLQEAIIGTTELAIISTNTSGIITSFNHAAENLLGYKSEEVIGSANPLQFHDYLEIIQRAEILSREFKVTVEPGFDAVVAKARLTRSSDRHEWTFVRKDGTRFPVLLSVSALYDDTTDLTGYVGIATDITSQKLVENELRRMADENERIFNDSITLNCVAGFDGFFKKLNPVWHKTLGWTLDELKEKKFIEFIHPDDIENTIRVSSSIIKGNQVSTFENRYRTKDGSYKWLLWTSSPDMERQLIYASAIDITDRKKSEEELLRSKNSLEIVASGLQEQNKQLDEFAHIISHNLRSPIGNIKALIGLLNEKSSVEEYQLIFEKLRNLAGNLGETMNELMETIKVKKNNDVEIVTIRFKDMLDKVVQSLEGDLIQNEATVTFDFNSASQIEYSKTYLESIFQNLISNAVKYRSPERKPEIHISTHYVNNRIELRVKDNGLGIDLEKFGARLFGLHKTFHDNKEARGVGLFLTKTQIETMGGTIRAESEVNKGTTFIVRF